ncbi:MAG: tRNA (guanosine(37)-N1)-methyltransferase TrmD [Alphaproteobacteria bacterium]|nr:tRNA (guanosine(37)-N1)-methyltransferase TrmD [Alphaproteobacteria bacterium]
MLITVVTLFPEMFPGPLTYSLLGKKLGTLWNLKTVNIRDFSDNIWHKVDDTPYGGGAGMVLKPNIVHDSLNYALSLYNGSNPTIVYMTPRGQVLNSNIAKKIVNNEGIIILCGRYEGIDQRVIDFWKTKHNLVEISIGDYVLFGGEIPAMVLIETCLRFIPGIMHNSESVMDESFAIDLLEYPQYTKPAIWCGNSVPSVLLSGNHLEIAKWRTEQSKQITKALRPDLWKKYLELHSDNGE